MPAGIVNPNRKAGKGIVGYRTPSMLDLEHPLNFQGKDHSQRPGNSTKRIGRRRGKGGGGVQGAMRRLAAAVNPGVPQ
jgi:hypothetical protein